jgi:hypothetical protein
MMKHVLVVALACAPMLVHAQNPMPSPRAQVIQRAQRLVNDGNGMEGRALMDSLLNATEPRSPDEAEVLYWRAALAESWDQAQRDYLRVMLEHERSPFAATAMLRLAQGELMRGDRDAALRYLERLIAEAPAAPERADAAILRDRIMAVAVAATPISVPPTAPTSAPSTPPVAPPTTTPTPTPVPPAAPTTTAPVTPPPSAVWSVQIAAFPLAEEAATFAATMREKGYDTRVDGIAAPFRVRFGRYATRTAATAAMDAYRTKERADAFLTQVPR